MQQAQKLSVFASQDPERQSIYESRLDLLENVELIEKNALQMESLLRQLLGRVEQESRYLIDLRQALESVLAALPRSAVAPSPSPSRQLSIYCLSSFKVCIGGQEVPLRRVGKGAVILKYLAANARRPVPRDVLLEMLWPDVDPQTANNRLKVTVHQLRQAFLPLFTEEETRDFLLSADSRYQLNPEMDIWTDVDAFEEAWRQGNRLERQGLLEEAVVFYQRAESLYHSDFLEEDLLEEWTLARREALRDTFLILLGKLNEYWFKTGSTEQAIEGWKRVIAKDPWREDAYRNLMICYARHGQRALALRWYEICEQTLKAQLNLCPETDTTRLYQEIRAG